MTIFNKSTFFWPIHNFYILASSTVSITFPITDITILNLKSDSLIEAMQLLTRVSADQISITITSTTDGGGLAVTYVVQGDQRSIFEHQDFSYSYATSLRAVDPELYGYLIDKGNINFISKVLVKFYIPFEFL